MKLMKQALYAFHYLTIIPLSADMRVKGEEEAGALIFFPLVGLLAGAVVATLGYAAQYLYPAPALWAAVCIIMVFALSGGGRQSALSETCDALSGRARREKTRQNPRDAHVGALGASAIALDFLFQYTVLTTLHGRGSRLSFNAVIAAQVCACFAMAVCAALGSCAEDDPDKRLINGAGWRHALPAAAIAALCLLPFLGGAFWTPLLAAALVAGIAAPIFKRAPGGVTGAALGAVHQLAQAFVLTMFLWEGVMSF